MKFFKPAADVSSPTELQLTPWKLAIIDDDPQVHAVTRLVLANTRVDDQPLEFLFAHSAAEGLQLFEQHSDIALAFVDVIMESDDAGLKLIQQIREQLHNHSTRIVLRTGQPGSSPEETVIRNYDINDYKSKTELTDTKLKTCVYSSIRSYRDIITIENSKRGMRQVISASAAVLRSQSLYQFGNAILAHTLELLNIKTAEMYLVSQHRDVYGDCDLVLLAATGKAVRHQKEWNTELIPADIQSEILHALETKHSSHQGHTFIGYYPIDDNTQSILYARFQAQSSPLEQEILKLFAANITLIFQNLNSRENIQETQKELLLVLGDAIEQRSKETGAHVRRVSLMCELMALNLGASQEFSETLKYAAPLHDVGKIAIPEEILHKPGKLNPSEWETMQTHAEIGYELLKDSRRAVAKMGARIAFSHHEHWDGNGYPRGLQGEAIPLEGRIVAIVDVIDALAAERCYKKPWPEADIIRYLQERRGSQFDPQLVDLALALFDEFRTIRALYPDHSIH